MSDHDRHHWWEKKYDWDRPALWHAKHVAWALVIGERPRAGGPRSARRQHRGLLPDVDLDRAVIDPGRRPLARRIAQWLWARIRPAEATLPAELAGDIGESLVASYIGEEPGGAATNRPQGEAKEKYDWSRAA
jgi:hypothetical protein